MMLRNFVVFEGIDGTGTTTQLRALRRRFAERDASGARGERVAFTAEPTSGETGRLIRRILGGEVVVHPDTMARLFAADRGEHLYGAGGIMESLASGLAVFSDRYLFSSLAYQGEAGTPDLPVRLNESFPMPEFLFFFDIDPRISMQRVESRQEKTEIYERLDFQSRVRERYLDVLGSCSGAEPDMTVITLDASDAIPAITDKIWSIVRDLPKL